jgi:hypothetical protein
MISLILEITFATILLAAAYYFHCQNSSDPQKTESKLREMLQIAKNLINLLHWILAKIKRCLNVKFIQPLSSQS